MEKRADIDYIDKVLNGEIVGLEKRAVWPILAKWLIRLGIPAALFGGGLIGHELGKKEDKETTPRVAFSPGAAALPLSLAAAGLLAYKLFGDKRKKTRLQFPKEMVLDVPIEKTSEGGLMESGIFPLFAGGALGLPIVYELLTSVLRGSKSERRRKEIQATIDRLRHISLPYKKEVMAEQNLDLMLDALLEKQAGLGDTIAAMAEKMPGAATLALILGLLGGGGYIGGKLLTEHLTYDPLVEKMKLEEEFGDILEPVEDIPIKINPIYIQKLKEEKERKKRKRLLLSTQETLSEDIDVSQIL